MSGEWTSWTLTAIAMALVVVTALVTGLVVASWTGEPSEADERRSGPAARDAARTPTPADVQACNVYARAVARGGSLEAIAEATGVAVGTVYGVDEPRARDARYVQAYRACMKGRGFTG
jgi:hypothetical protein